MADIEIAKTELGRYIIDSNEALNLKLGMLNIFLSETESSVSEITVIVVLIGKHFKQSIKMRI